MASSCLQVNFTSKNFDSKFCISNDIKRLLIKILVFQQEMKLAKNFWKKKLEKVLGLYKVLEFKKKLKKSSWFLQSSWIKNLLHKFKIVSSYELHTLWRLRVLSLVWKLLNNSPVRWKFINLQWKWLTRSYKNSSHKFIYTRQKIFPVTKVWTENYKKRRETYNGNATTERDGN